MTKEQIAEVCHEVNRAYCDALGDTSQPEWKDAPQWQKDSALLGVELHLAHPDAGPEQSHESWLAQKQAEGWRYGLVKDPVKKEHPCCVPFNELPMHQQAKDFIFRAVVKQLGALVSVLLLVVVAGCAPHHEMIQHGNQKILFSQTQNVWTDNVLLVTPCKEKLANGQCDPDGPTQVTTATGKGAGIVGGVGGGVVSALIIRDGLVKGKPKVNNSNNTNEFFSTKNPVQPK